MGSSKDSKDNSINILSLIKESGKSNLNKSSS